MNFKFYANDSPILTFGYKFMVGVGMKFRSFTRTQNPMVNKKISWKVIRDFTGLGVYLPVSTILHNSHLILQTTVLFIHVKNWKTLDC